MNVLGVNLGARADGSLVYDGAAALIVDGRVTGAIAEERLNRKKHSGGCAASSSFVLEQAGLSLPEVDLVVVATYGEEPRRELFGDLGFSAAPRVEMMPSHHLAHAYSAFFPSDLDDALILVADNEGGIIGPRRHRDTWKNAMERLTVYRGTSTSIALLERDMAEEDVVSLGELYGNVTHYVGFDSYQHAGKTMALASLGDPTRFAGVPLVERLADGRLRCPMQNDYEDSLTELRRHFATHGVDLPPPLVPGAHQAGLAPQVYLDLAAAAQHQLEEGLIHKVRHWTRVTGLSDVAFAGGVALNCVANRRLLDEVPLRSLFVQPNAGDQGLALGAALYGWIDRCGGAPPQPGDAYLGGDYDDGDCRRALDAAGCQVVWTEGVDLTEVAGCLAAGKVVGWFQGRSEWGPRALGNRSLLADPRRADMKDHINATVKHREGFRPFAPAVPVEFADRYFEPGDPAPYMTVTARIRADAADQIPAVAHVDGTARLQTVDRATNPAFHSLLCEFGRLTGVPVLLNTSFNRQEPIVESPDDAIACFTGGGIDLLVLGSFIVRRAQ